MIGKSLYTKIFIPILSVAILLTSTTVHATGKVRDLQNKSDALNQELENQQAELVSVLTQIEELQEEIALNQAEIDQTEIDLAAAQEAEQTQYKNMCKRIKYNYENKEDSLFTIVVSSANFTDFLNQVEYASEIYKYDNQMLDIYQSVCMEIQDLKADLEAQKAAMSIMQQDLGEKQAQLNALIEKTKARKADVDTQLQAAKEEAARIARAQAAAREQARNDQRVQQNAASANANGAQGSDPAPRTGISGAEVVAYANQFVGGPYVWGGNSLTGGIDCSGFVVQVYKHFGIDLSGSRYSGALRSVGQAVGYEHMKAGDIVCYAGHVGIYTGAGTIVEAQSASTGITNYRSVNSKSILAIRRVI